MFEQFIRTEMLIGKESLERLKNSKVAIFGVGGVGSYVVEGLARAGVGHFVLVDNDTVAESNINRQLVADYNTLGQDKVEVAKRRILLVNPDAEVETHKIFYLPGQEQNIIDGCDYVVDAIDTVSAKIALVEECSQKEIKIISSMGTGNKLNPTMFKVSDIYKTSVCPLCRVMRRELKKRNIQHLKVVYSEEEPIIPLNLKDSTVNAHSSKRQTPASISFVPSVAGLIIASEVVKDIIDTSKST